MAEPVGALRVDVAANVAQIQDDLGKVKSIVNSFANEASRSFGTFAKGANKALSEIFNLRNAAAVLAATTMVELIRRAVDAGDEIAKTAQKIGISTDALQELRYAANGAGVTTADFDQALLQLSKRLGDTSGDVTDTAKALGKLGISMADVKGKDTAQVVALIADRIRLVPDAMQRAKIATDLFGKSGQQLLPVLMTGGAGLAAMADEARKLGFVISSDTLKKTEEANDEFTKIGKSFQAAGINIAAGFLPALKELRAVVTSQDFQDGVKSLAQNFADLIKWMVDNKSTILTVAGAFQGMRMGAAVGGAIGGKRGALLGGMAGAVGGGLAGSFLAGDSDEAKKAIKSVEDEIAVLEAQLKSTAGQITETNDPTLIGQLASKADLLKQKIAEDRDQLARLKKDSEGGPTQVQVDVPKTPITPVMPEADKAITDLAFKTRILRNDFIGLADGFPELAHGLKIFGDTTYGTFSQAVTSVEQLPEPLRKLNEEVLKNNAAKVIASTRSEQDQFNIALQKLQQLQPYLTVDQYGRALNQLRYPNLQRTIDDATNLNKAFDQVATNGLNSTADALTDIATGASTAGEAFQKLAQSVIRDLTQMIIKALLFRAVASLFGFSSGGPVGFLGFSDGGGVKMAGGGALFGPGSGTSDSIPAMLSNGEYVINAKAAAPNMDLLDAINFGGFQLPHFATGGAVSGAAAVTMSGSNDNGTAGVTIMQEINNNFPPGMSGADRAYYDQKIAQSSEAARRAAVQDVKGLNLRRTG